MSEQITDEFRAAMSSWVEIKTQLAEARKDMKVLNTREKELKEFIKGYMKNHELDLINLRKGKVTLKTTEKKASFTYDLIEKGLTVFFNGNEVDVERAMTCIVDTLPKIKSEAISLTGLKTKAP